MERELFSKLQQWKASPYRKPLVLKGARQVGKSYLLEEFGRREYEDHVLLNCDREPRIAEIFEGDLRTERIISDIELLCGRTIEKNKTLLIIDEIGEAPRALAALKYFCEDAPEYHIIVAGSLLGLQIHKGTSYPVGKVDEMTLYPMSFSEFLAARRGEAAAKKLLGARPDELNSMHSFFEENLREYYFTGGMPEVVQGLLNGRSYEELRNIQKRIIADYALDISKHAAGSILGRIHQVWNSIPQQLARSNKKFVYADIQRGARAKDFELAIEWLLDAGIIYRIPRVKKAGVPLKFYEDFTAFKLFLLDHGLMGAMVDAAPSEILLNKNVFEEYRGTFTEQYVLEQLISHIDTGIFYYDSDSSKLELDFLIQREGFLLPIEVKAEENLRSKSLRTFFERHPDSRPLRLSMSPYRRQEWLTNLPLYAACRVADVPLS